MIIVLRVAAFGRKELLFVRRKLMERDQQKEF
jgi:hypothetical protein